MSRKKAKPAKIAPGPVAETKGPVLPDAIEMGREEILSLSNIGLQKQLADQNYQVATANINAAYQQVIAPILSRAGITLDQWVREYRVDGERNIARRLNERERADAAVTMQQLQASPIVQQQQQQATLN